MAKDSKPTVATYVGLFCALVVPLLALPTRIILKVHRAPLGFLANEAFFWSLTAVVLLILIVWEREPLARIGLGRAKWASVGWGMAGAVVVRIAVVAALGTYAAVSGRPIEREFAYDFGLITRLGALPVVVLFLLALRAAVTEEILFRGYGIERLGAVMGSRSLAALVCLAVFTIAHLGAWDATYLIVVFPAGLVLTLLYLWRRDLWANMYAHFFTDAIGLAAAYVVNHHLLDLRNMPGTQ